MQLIMAIKLGYNYNTMAVCGMILLLTIFVAVQGQENQGKLCYKKYCNFKNQDHLKKFT